MFAHQFLRVATALVILESSQALAGDVITLQCDFPGYYDKIIADQKGISITEYKQNKETGKLEYVKVYYENKKDETSEQYYRINSAEIAWGSTYNLLGTVVKLDSTIDLRAGTVREDTMIMGKEIKQRPTEAGTCKPD
jgi:hypothetical protein